MDKWICVTCGTQFPPSQEAPSGCPICLDQRQYVGHNGQQWTTLEKMQQGGFSTIFKEEEPHLMGIGTKPSFAIGERPLLLQTPGGNILWDCMTFLDDATVEAVQKLGGISAIAISHPHYYSTMVEWAKRFNARIYLSEADRQWVMRPDERITFWSGDTYKLWDDITLIRLGGHFKGGTVLHWPAGADGRGVLLSGDILQVVSDRRFVSFMYSYPNLLPLPTAEVRRMSKAIAAYRFERLYGAWFERVVSEDASNAVQRSADRYIRAIEHGLE